MREEREKEYCKLLLPLVSCLERWVVCLLPRRTRYCATYLRTHPAAKVFFHLLLIFPFVYFSFVFLVAALAVLPRCNRSDTSKEVLFRKSEPLYWSLHPSQTQILFIRFRNSLFFAIRLCLLII